MKTVVALAVALMASTSVAFAAEPAAKPTKPTKLTEAQMDRVTGGALLNVVVNDVLNRNNVEVRVPIDVEVSDINVNAAAAVAVLGTAGAVGGIAD
jgi:hypothetical protein